MTGIDWFKDFAGPATTIIASISALIVTAYFGRKQIEIAVSQAATATVQKEVAASQRDIAYDRLKYDLFEKWYTIYVAARKLINHIMESPYAGPLPDGLSTTGR